MIIRWYILTCVNPGQVCPCASGARSCTIACVFGTYDVLSEKSDGCCEAANPTHRQWLQLGNIKALSIRLVIASSDYFSSGTGRLHSDGTIGSMFSSKPLNCGRFQLINFLSTLLRCYGLSSVFGHFPSTTKQAVFYSLLYFKWRFP